MWTFVDLKINKRVDALIILKNKRVDKKLWICQRTKQTNFWFFGFDICVENRV